MKLFCTFCLSSAIVLVAACGRPKTVALVKVYPGYTLEAERPYRF